MAVWRLRMGRMGVLLGMSVEHLKVWLRDASREKELEPRRWGKLVIAKILEFREGCISTALTWTTMLVIAKGEGVYIGIVLVEVIWTVCLLIMKNRLQAAIILQNLLHGFRRVGAMEAKMSQLIVGLVYEPLF